MTPEDIPGSGRIKWTDAMIDMRIKQVDEFITMIRDGVEAQRELPYEAAETRRMLEELRENFKEFKREVRADIAKIMVSVASVDVNCQTRFDKLDQDTRKNKRDLLIALATFTAPIVVALIARG